MEKPTAIVFAAKGKGSLSIAQQSAIEKVAGVQYRAILSPLPDDQFIEACQTAEYIGLTRRACKDFHAGIIHSLPCLKGVSVYATGTEWIEVKELQNQQIAWRFLPDYSLTTVAEHAIGMLLTLSRRIHLSDRIAAAELPSDISLRGWELSGKTLGIIGMGRIGTRIAKLAQVFGMQVIFHDPNVQTGLEFRKTPFLELIQQADVLMLAASVDRLHPVIMTAEVLSACKPGVYLINPARPALVDQNAILNAIQSGKISGYAVDDFVFSPDEIKRVKYGCILQTGHTGWYSNEAMARGTEMWINHLVELITHA
jgi:phosphoglycerate dehydrogenase-like enzyme